MKKIVISLFCIFCAWITKAEDLQYYYKYINKAELSICNNNYAKALKLYAKAFSKKEIVFDKDYHNAFLCSYYLQDTALMKNYFFKLRQRACDFTDFTNRLDSTQKQNFYLFYNKYKDVEPITDKSYNHFLDSLFKEDQEVRSRNYNLPYAQRIELIRSADSANFLGLVYLQNKYGFMNPSNVNFYTPAKDFMIMLHALCCFDTTIANQAFQHLTTVYKKAVIDGKFNAFQYADLFDRSTENTILSEIYHKQRIYKLSVNDIDDTLYIPIYDNEKEINHLRQQIYIEPLANTRVKVAYIFRNPKKGFKLNIIKNRYVGLSDEQALKMKNNTIKVFKK